MFMRFLLPALVLSAASATAQPTLTVSTNMPVPGLANTVFRASSATPGPAGANQTWNFSSLTSTATATSNYAACPGAPDCGTFPSANLTGNEQLMGNQMFYDASSSVLSVVGVRGAGTPGGPIVNTFYSDPEDYLRFPMTFNSTYTDPSKATFTLFGQPATHTATTTVHADAWGTLILPGNNTYNNVLRVKRTTAFVDSSNGLAFITGTATAYMWYSTAYKEFLMIIGQVNTSQGNVTSVGWVVPGVAGVKDAESDGLAFVVSPNPAQDHIALRWAAGMEATLSLQDLTGHTVLQTSGRGDAAMDVGGLPRGLYMLRATGADGITGTQKILLQ
jgi:hypothetical protein